MIFLFIYDGDRIVLLNDIGFLRVIEFYIGIEREMLDLNIFIILWEEKENVKVFFFRFINYGDENVLICIIG